MKRSLSVMLVGIIIASDMYMSPVVVNASTEESTYSGSYGSQLENERENDYSKMIYDELVDKYVYLEDGEYKNLARPIESNDTEISMDFSDITYSVEAANVDGVKAGINKWAEEVQKIFSKAVNDAYAAFARDYPEVYWINEISYNMSISSGMTGGSDKVKAEASISRFSIKPEEAFTGARASIGKFNNAVVATKESVIRKYGVNSNTSKANSAKAIHDYLALRLSYNHDAAANGIKGKYAVAYTPFYAFVDNNANSSVVCEGYAKAFKILANQLGIKNAILTGAAINQNNDVEQHMWNAVQLEDGKWYAVDVTWDDQEYKTYYNYFLAGRNSKGFKYAYYKDHIANVIFSNYEQAKEFALPQIAEKGYLTSADGTTEQGTYEDNTKGDYKVEAYEKYYNQNTTVGSNTNYTWKILNFKNMKYTGKAVKQNIKIECNGVILKEGTDYKLAYTNNIKAGKATMHIIPRGKYITTKGQKLQFNISKVSISKASSKKIKAKKYKNGKAIKPAVTLKYKGVKLVKGKDYTVKYKKNKNKGTAKIIIKGKGNFKGKKTIKFKIK